MLQIQTRAALFLAALLVTSPTITLADGGGDISVFERLRLANVLSTNTQKIARLSCSVLAGLEPEQERELLAAALDDFSRYSNALTEGDAELGLLAESSQRVRNGVDDVRDLWLSFAPRITEIANGAELDTAGMMEIDLYSLSLMNKSNELQTRISNVYGEAYHAFPLILTLTVDMVERQVMRTEMVAKEACLISLGVDVEKRRAMLAKTLTAFSATLDALIEGYPGLIVPAPSAEILQKLEHIRSLWEAPMASLSALYQGEDISAQAQSETDSQLRQVALELAEASALYTAILMEM